VEIFLYDDLEAEQVLRDIEMCSKIGVEGVVIGALNKEAKIDIPRCREWAECAKSNKLNFSFHRAIDRTDNILEAMEVVISLGYKRILTSGGRISAIEGRETIKSMVDKSDGRVEIMAGSGINTSNIFDIITATGVKNIHFSASKSRLSGMEVLAGIGKTEYLTHSDSKAIEEAKTIISSFK
jgi:copper homeostasis protein